MPCDPKHFSRAARAPRRRGLVPLGCVDGGPDVVADVFEAALRAGAVTHAAHVETQRRDAGDGASRQLASRVRVVVFMGISC